MRVDFKYSGRDVWMLRTKPHVRSTDRLPLRHIPLIPRWLSFCGVNVVNQSPKFKEHCGHSMHSAAPRILLFRFAVPMNDLRASAMMPES